MSGGYNQFIKKANIVVYVQDGYTISLEIVDYTPNINHISVWMCDVIS